MIAKEETPSTGLPAHDADVVLTDRSSGPAPAVPTGKPSVAEPARFVDRYLASVLALASHRISAEFHVKVKQAGLSVTEWRIMASLFESTGETVGELARLALTKQPTLSKVLPRLEAQGYITLRTARADRRQTLVKLTAKGNRLVSPLCGQAMAHQHQVLSKLDADHAERLVAMLRSIVTP